MVVYICSKIDYTNSTRRIKYEGGTALLDFVKKEIQTFVIIARDVEMFILGNSEKNVKFSREKMKVLDRFVFDQSTKKQVNRK